jgi:alpha-tubulin suppressor-like RCC1 family protein
MVALKMRSRVLPSLAVLLLLSAVATPHAQQLRKIGEMELSLVGLSATVDGARPAIPKNVASGVRILIHGGGSTLAPAAAARLLGAFEVEAELSGPSFGETITVRQSVTTASTEAHLILPLPSMAVSGEHTLSNLRIVSGGRPVLDLQPRTVPVDVVEQVLITSVRTRPLTLDEIKAKGIVLDSDDYLGFEFTLGVLLESKPVNVAFPVVFDKQGIAVPLPQSVPGLSVRDLDAGAVDIPKLLPMMLKVPKLSPAMTLGLEFDSSEIRIPSLLVIPGEVGYLKQFFSAQLFVGNGTPGTANLVVRDVTGTLELPKGLDATAGTADDPLSLAETVKGIQPITMNVAGIGPDGLPGTADDVTSLRPGEQGQAEFLVRGDLEGFHNIAFDIDGILDGLPTGPIEVTGRATGGVLVRNPFFDVSFTLPTVVRANEPFKLYATVTNKGAGIANDVSMTLDALSLSGLNLLGDATQSIATLMPGEAETLVFDFESLRTGQAVATYLRFEGPGATGSLKFKVGVGERGVPLSPDTLVLPAQVDELPPTVISTAMRVLGQAWSIANTPPNAMPPGVARISKPAVMAKALALAEAGLRIRLGQPDADAIRDLLPDFYGPAPIDRGFDQLLRTTDAGRNLNRAIGAALAPSAASNVFAFEQAFAGVAASGQDFISFAIANGSAGADVNLTLLDAGKRVLTFTGADTDPRPAVTATAIAPLGPPASSPLFGVIAAPTAVPYTLELTGRGGGPVDLSVTYPRGDGHFTRATAMGFSVPAGAKARLTIDPARASPSIEIDTDGNGSIDTTVMLSTGTISASGPRLISASVVGPETLDNAGPFGFNVALLFDRVVSDASAKNPARYSIPDNQLVGAHRQLSGRLVFGSLAKPEGPYVPTSITVSGMTDDRGIGVGTESRPLQSLLTDIGAVVSGRVLNGDGQLAAGVRVIYFHNPNWQSCEYIPPKAFAQAITDAEGRYQFRYVNQDRCGHSWRMHAFDEINHSERSVTGRVRTAGERITADIALLGRGSVTGVIRDFGGNPVPDAKVVAASTLEPQVGGGATTDGDGRYTITGITVGPVSVKAAKGMSAGTAAGLIARAGTTATVDLTLVSGTVSISGAVKTVENGVVTPVPGAVVVYRSPDPLGNDLIVSGVATTAQDGSYTLTSLPAGPYSLQAKLGNGDTETLSGVAGANDVITGRDILVFITRNGRVSGMVRFANGTPVPRPIVTFGGSGVVGGDDGTFDITQAKVSPQAQDIHAYSSDGSREGGVRVLLNQSGQHLSNVTVTLNGVGTLDLVVIDSLGNPVRNQIVQIARTGSNISPTDCTAFFLAPTDDQGRVRFEGLEVGQVKAVSIRATANGVDIAKFESTIPHDTAVVTGVLRFGGGGSIRGTIRDDRGDPVFGANIEVSSRYYDSRLCQLVGGISHRIRTSLNGEYRVTGVPVGDVSVTASQEFYPTPISKRGSIARDGDELVIDLNLIHTTAGKITGTVFLPDGVTPAGAGVTVSAIGALPEVLVTTTADGKYALPEIFPAGSYTVTVRDPATGFVAQERISLTAGVNVVRDFRLRGRGTVKVTVVDGAGVAIPNALVTLTESEYPGEKFEAVIEASNEGVVTFSNIHEGGFSVAASDIFGRGGRVSGEVPAHGSTIELTVRLSITGTVTGRFSMPDGVTMIPLAAVKLIAGGRIIGNATTSSGDDIGSFTFTYVPAGTVRLEALDPATGRSGVALGQLTTEGQVLTLDVRAQGLGTVSGRVLIGTTGQNGAHVEVSSGTFKAQTSADAAGNYSVPGVPEGAVTVRADMGGALPGTAAGTLVGDGATLTLDVQLQASGTVTGVVTSAGGVTPAPPSIVAIRVGNSRLTTTTNELGEYRFVHIPVGTHSLSVDVLGSIDTALGSVTVTANQTSAAPMQLIGVGGISGTALAASGAPASGTVTLTGGGQVGWSITLPVGFDGSFTAAQVLAGPFTAQVRNSDGPLTLYGTAAGSVTPGQTASIVVTLQATGDVRGTVLRADNATVPIGATVTLKRGTQITDTAQVFSDGSFSFIGLPLGTYSVAVYDSISNGYARSIELILDDNGDVGDTGVLVLDDSAPGVQSINPADGTVGVSRTQPVVVTFSDPLTGTGGINIKKGTSSLSATRTLSTDARSVTLTGTWPDSSEITVEVTTGVTDVFGRHPAAQVTSRFFTVDTTAPTVATITPAHDAYQVAPGAAIVATFSESVANASVDGVIAVARAGVPVAGTAVKSAANAITFTPDAPLSDNAIYTVTIDGAVDASGNEQGNASVTTFSTTDTIAPVLAITSPSSIDWIRDRTPTIQVTRSDATSGVNQASVTLSLNGTAVAWTGSSSISYTVPATAPLADGTHTIVATVADRAGNVGTVSGSFRLDDTNPTTPVITAPADGASVTGQTTITATASDEMSGLARIEVERGGSLIENLLPPTFTGTWNANGTADGLYTLTATAVDVAGNRGASSTSQIVVDNDPLVLTITAPAANLRSRKPVNAAATVSEPAVRVEFTLGAVTVTDTSSPFTATLPVDALPEGNATITVRAIGLLGEVVTQTRVIIVDRSSPVGRWPFDEGTGTTAADASGNNHPGTLVNGTAWTGLGQFSKAVVFDGVDDGVSVADSDDFDATIGVTMAAWIAPASFGAPQAVIYRGGSAHPGYTLSLEADGRVTAVIYPDGVATVVTSTQPVSLTLWSHVAATYDQSALRLYVNGVEVSSVAASGLLTTTDGPVWLGRADVADSFNGKLDETRIYDRALSAAEVLVLGTSPSIGSRLGGGTESSFVAQPGGTVWAFGYQLSGDLGVGSGNGGRPRPTPVVGMTDVVDIAAGEHHGLMLTSAGTVYAFGDNIYGNIGDGTTTDRSTPVPVALDSIVAVAAGRFHSLALRSNGDVYSWGRNENGQQADGTTTVNALVPRLIMGGVKAIAAGSGSSLFVKTDGTVWGVGADGQGQLGAGSATASRLVPVQMLGVTGAVDAAAGNSFSVIRLANGTLKAAGDGSRLGQGVTTDRSTAVAVLNLTDVIRVVTGIHHTLALKADGTVWSFGYNAYGQLGDGTDTTALTALQVPGLANISDIGAGWYHSLAVTESGVVYGWGENGSNEVGDGGNRHRLSPVAISIENYVWKLPTPTMSSGGTFGANTSTTVNIATTGATIRYTRDGLEPTEADPIVAAGGSIPIDSTQTVTVKAFKDGMPPSNVESQTFVLQPATPTMSPTGASGLTAPQNVTMAVSTVGAVIRYTIGTPTLPPDDPTEASPQYTSTIVITGPSVIKARAFKPGWTPSAVRNYTFSYTLAAPVFSPPAGAYTGSISVAMSAQPGVTIRYAFANFNVNSCTAGTVYTGPIAITNSAGLRARACHPDYTMSPQLNADYAMTAATPVLSLPSGSYDPGTTVTVTGDPATTIRYSVNGSDPTANSPTIANGGTIALGNFTLKVRAFLTSGTASALASATYTINSPLAPPTISAGDSFVLAPTPDGRLFGWGRNHYGQFGNGAPTQYQMVPTLVDDLTGVVAAAGGEAHSLFLLSDGTVWGAGSNGVGQLGDGVPSSSRNRPVQVQGLTDVVAVAAGYEFSLALLANGDVYGWGRNASGELADGGATPAPITPILIMSGVKAIAAGRHHSVFVKLDGTVWASGENGGRLGDGTTTLRKTPVQMIGVAGAVAVAAGSQNSYVLLDDGTVRGVGLAPVGDGVGGVRTTAVTVAGLSNVIQVAAGDGHALALKADGSVWAWGDSNEGQIGTGPISGNVNAPVQVPVPSPIVAIAAGPGHSAAVTIDGVVYTWGTNYWGESGDGGNRNRSFPVSLSEPGYQWRVTTPALHSNTGTYSQDLSVTVTTLTSGATIRYTRNGSEPTEADPVVASGGTVLISNSQTLTVKAWKAGMPASNSDSQTYTLKVAQPTFSPNSSGYSTPQTVTMTTSTPGASIRYTVDGTEPTVESTLYTGPFTLSTSTTFKMKGFKAGYSESNTHTRTVGFNFGTLAAPVVSPGAGTYQGSVVVSMSTSQPGAVIRYTTTGTSPGSQSPLYTAPITLTSTTTLRARVFHADYTTSPEFSGQYTIQEPATHLRVTYRTPDGMPIAGAVVFYQRDWGNLYREATTDAAGVALISDITSGGYTLWVEGPEPSRRASGDGTITSAQTGQTVETEVTAPTIGPVRVRLLGADGLTPAPFFQITDIAEPWEGRRRTADEHGIIDFENITAWDGGVDVEVFVGDRQVQHTATRSSDGLLEIPVVLPAAVIRGIVTFDDGTPAPDVSVTAEQQGEWWWQTYYGVADPNVPGGYVIVGPDLGEVAITAEDSLTSIDAATTITVTDLQATAVPTLVLPAYGTVRGVVRNSVNEPVPYAGVVIETASGSEWYDADEFGEYIARYIPVGPVTVSSSLNTGVAASATGTLAGALSTLVLDVTLPPYGTVSGVVRNNDGTPASGVYSVVEMDHAEFGHFGIFTDENGYYELPFMPLGAYVNVTAWVYDTGLRGSGSGGTLASGGGTLTLDVTLDPAATITGTVRTEGGQPSTNAYVKLQRGSDAVLNASVNASGVFTFSHVPQGTITVAAFDQSVAGRPVYGQSVVNVNSPTATIDVTVESANLTIIVKDSNGTNVSGASVAISNATGTLWETQVSSVSNVPAAGFTWVRHGTGQLTLTASRQGKTQTVTVTHVNGVPQTVTIILPP